MVPAKLAANVAVKVGFKGIRPAHCTYTPAHLNRNVERPLSGTGYDRFGSVCDL
jgi:hypothetical protein